MISANVLQICSYYIGSKLYQKFFDALEVAGIEQDVYVFTRKGYVPHETWDQNVFLAPCYRDYERLFFHLKHKRVLNNIRVRVDVGQYSLSHAHSLFSNGYVAHKLFRRYGLPYIVAVRNTDVNLFFRRMPHLRHLGRTILRDASCIVFLSNPYRDFTLENFVRHDERVMLNEKSIVLPNGIDDFWIENRFSDRQSPEPRTVKVIYVGTVDGNKNVDTTISACRILIDQGYSVNFTIVGRIVDHKYTQILASNKFVRYIPHCNKEELIDYYREADIFVMPSKHETFGLVYAEAMSQGLPVIYTRGQGFDGQFSEGEVGFSVKCDDSNEIAARVLQVLDDYNDISRRAIASVHRYSWADIAQKYMRIYAEVLDIDTPNNEQKSWSQRNRSEILW